MLSYVAKHSKPLNYKSDQITMNLHRFDVQTIKNVELRRKPFKTAKLQKWSKYNDFHRFDFKNIKTTHNYKNYQITWIASIWCPNDQNNAKLQKRANYDELHAFDIKTNENVALGRKTFETTQNYKSDQIGRKNEQKWWVTSQTIQNNAKLQKWSKYNDLHRFDVKSDQVTMNLHRFGVKTS